MILQAFASLILLTILISESSGQCPVLPPGTIGTCVELCSSDSNCGVNQKCCSNGCGHVCTNVTVVFNPGECPILPPDTVGICLESCSNDNDCRSDEKCCSNGCGRQCTRACIPQKCDCQYGVNYFKINGCVFCSCKQNSCDLVKCPDNTICQIDSENIAHCIPIQHNGVCPAKPKLPCKPCCADGDCSADEKCCGKCCRKACFPMACKCPYGTIFSDDSNGCSRCNCRPNPCDVTKCPKGTTCELVENVCSTRDCPPFRSKCVPLCKYGKPLQNVYCGRGGTSCPTGYSCNIAPDDRYAVCCPLSVNPCDKVKCDVGQTCVLRDVVCVKAPCYPIAECISNSTLKPDPCSQIKCKDGEKCVLEEVVCIRAPCDPVPKCVPGCSPVLCKMFCENGFKKMKKDAKYVNVLEKKFEKK